MENSVLVNDVHSALNPTRVAEVERPTSVDALRDVLRNTRARGGSLAVSGSRHAMGGQQFLEGQTLLDMRGLNRVLHVDCDRGLVTAEAGIDWPTLIDGYLQAQRSAFPDQPPRWGIAQKQTGADRLTLGGALSANVHGRGLMMKPIVGDVESFRVMNADGEIIECSRKVNNSLFAAAIGGYGLFGPIVDVTLRLAPRTKLRRVVRVIDIEDAVNAAQRRIDAGYIYGDFQFDVSPTSPEFLTKGVFSCYQPVSIETPLTESARELSPEAWDQLLYFAHTDKKSAFEKYAQHYLATDGQIYWSDLHQLSVYSDGYHQRLDQRLGSSCPGSEMITELYVPPDQLVDFLRSAARLLSERGSSVIYGTIRLIRKDDETLLPWAREFYTCVIVNLHVDHTPAGIAHAGESFRSLIDLAISRGGSFYLTYHRFIDRSQIVAAYPRIGEFLALQKSRDPSGLFSSTWHRWLTDTLLG
jgi:FAD/FMN-containing dehydrogenase